VLGALHDLGLGPDGDEGRLDDRSPELVLGLANELGGVVDPHVGDPERAVAGDGVAVVGRVDAAGVLEGGARYYCKGEQDMLCCKMEHGIIVRWSNLVAVVGRVDPTGVLEGGAGFYCKVKQDSLCDPEQGLF